MKTAPAVVADPPATKQPAQPKKGKKKPALDDESDAASIKSNYSDDEDDFASKKKPAVKKTALKQTKSAEPAPAANAPTVPAIVADDAKPTQKKVPASSKGKVDLNRCSTSISIVIFFRLSATRARMTMNPSPRRQPTRQRRKFG